MVSDRHVSWLNDPDVVRYSEQRHKRHTIESVHQYVNDLRVEHGGHLWGIYTSEADMHIGMISAHIDTNNRIADLGILIGEKAIWGCRYGLEAWNAVSNWCFEQGCRKVEMGCHYENRAMRKVAERSGMILEGVRHDHFMVNGIPQHLLMYGKMRPANVKVTIDAEAQSVEGFHRQEV